MRSFTKSNALFEKAKKFFFFGEDTLIGSTEYIALPAMSITNQPPADREIALTDEKGAVVKLKVKFNHATEPAKAAP